VSAPDRLTTLADRWHVSTGRTFETATSLIAYGHRGAERVVVKVVKELQTRRLGDEDRREPDEWHSGDVAAAFGGRGMVRVLERVPGALLLERLDPGYSLVETSISGQDDVATITIARLIRSMQPDAAPRSCPAAHDWRRGFDWYAASGSQILESPLVARAQRIYADLADTQRETRLLHGDLQHSNILFDRARGWVAIDPKGVVGEVEFEIGASLRNPRELRSLVADPVIIGRRVDRFVAELGLDRERVVAWGFAQAVLSVIWSIQDGEPVDERDPSWLLAKELEAIVTGK
jgi:streptomycin 6-kinase